MRRVQILGAGSAGAHLAQACRRSGAKVAICDIDPDALHRFEHDIYPSRYGAWDTGIDLRQSMDDKTTWDLVVIATPPDSHLPLAREILVGGKTRALLIEKPLGPPDLEEILHFRVLCDDRDVKTFVGYNHVLTHSASQLEGWLRERDLGEPLQLCVSFKEHWQGIFDAHPWLAGPEDSYLGYVTRGGGGCCEHSHAINAFQHVCRSLGAGAGRISQVSCEMSFVDDGRLRYDRIAQMNVVTEGGLVGSIHQDVITWPPSKQVLCQFSNGQLRWTVNKRDGVDTIERFRGSDHEELEMEKTRPDDFFPEVQHIQRVLEGEQDYPTSPIHVQRGIDTMLVICAAFKAHRTRRCVGIDYGASSSESALYEMDG